MILSKNFSKNLLNLIISPLSIFLNIRGRHPTIGYFQKILYNISLFIVKNFCVFLYQKILPSWLEIQEIRHFIQHFFRQNIQHFFLLGKTELLCYYKYAKETLHKIKKEASNFQTLNACLIVSVRHLIIQTNN